MLRLARKLELRQPRLERLDSYLRGDPPLPEGADAARKAYIHIQKKARLNLAELAVEAVLDRMVPTGFQTGVAQDKLGDAKARDIWVANGLDVESTEVHRLMLGLGDSYVIVGGPDPETGIPVITAEDARQVVTAHDPARQQNIRAGLKIFHDAELEQDFAYLYLPGKVYVAFRDARRTVKNPIVRFSPSAWDWDESRGGEVGQSLPPGNETAMPVVRFRNKRGAGQFETHIDLLDRVNHMILQRMVIATFQAFKQRGIKVDPSDMPEKDENGVKIDYDEIFSADPGALWQLPQSADMWESGAVDLQPILAATKEDKMDFAALTRTPLYWFIPDAANGSASGADAQREGAVNQAEDRIRRASAGWNRVMSTAFRFMGDTERAKLPSLRTLWQPANRYTLSERADAGNKASDVPWETRMTDIWQFPPEKLEEMKAQRLQDAALATPAPAPVPAPADPAPEPGPAPVLPAS
ncbi:MAG TPA: phage portal protein [Nocardioides sp.]